MQNDLNGLNLRMAALERDLQATRSELTETREELRAIKMGEGSRAWRARALTGAGLMSLVAGLLFAAPQMSEAQNSALANGPHSGVAPFVIRSKSGKPLFRITEVAGNGAMELLDGSGKKIVEAASELGGRGFRVNDFNGVPVAGMGVQEGKGGEAARNIVLWDEHGHEAITLTHQDEFFATGVGKEEISSTHVTVRQEDLRVARLGIDEDEGFAGLDLLQFDEDGIIHLGLRDLAKAGEESGIGLDIDDIFGTHLAFVGIGSPGGLIHLFDFQGNITFEAPPLPPRPRKK